MQFKPNFGFLILLLFSLNGFSQQSIVSGIVSDEDSKELLFDSRILLLNPSDSSVIVYTNSLDSGNYVLPAVDHGTYILKATYFGYFDYFKRVELTAESNTINIPLKSNTKSLGEVEFTEIATRVEQKGDTTQYNAAAFKTNPDATVEDLVTKMPGITVENGVVKAQGEQIKKVLIDGEEYFGDDATAALKNLPAEIVSKIQVYDQASDQAKFTGISDGNEAKALNIVTKTGKNQGQFGKLYAGYGTPNDLYLGGLNVNIFSGKKRISIIGMSNNVNQQNFSTEDILGATGSSSSGSSGNTGGGRGRGGSDAASNFLVGQTSGVSTTHSLGINYSDKWGTKTRLTGSYFFNASRNDNTQFTNRTYFLSDTSEQLYKENYSMITTNFNHRLNFKFDIALDSMNSLVITPRVSVQGNDRTKNTTGLTTTSENTYINQIVNSTFAESSGMNASNSVLWRHRFAKPKRTFSFNVTGTYNNKIGTNGQESLSTYYDELEGDSTNSINQNANSKSNGYALSTRFSYTEPINDSWSAEIYYAPTYSLNDADKRTFNYDMNSGLYSDLDTSLSNVFNNKTLDNETGANFRFEKEKTSLQFGASYQNSVLLNDQTFPQERDVKLNFNNVLPNARFKYDFSKNKSFMLNYRTMTKNPTIDQLQNVIDNSNPLSLTSGNPDLEQQYNHRIFGRFNSVNTKYSSNFFVMLSGELYSNYITNSSLIAENDTIVDGIALSRGSQYRKPVNLDGTWNTRTVVSYGIPIPKLKINVNANLGAGYSETPGLINNEINRSQVTNTNAGLTIASNISDKIDFTVNYAYNYNQVVNTRQSSGNNNYMVHNLSARFNWIIKERLVFNTNYSMSSYAGLSSGYNQVIALWNGGVGYKLLKNKQLEARISVFDILNNNNSITRNVTETYVEDVESNVLNRYFMFTLTYSLRNFGKAPAKEERKEGDRPPFDGPPR